MGLMKVSTVLMIQMEGVAVVTETLVRNPNEMSIEFRIRTITVFLNLLRLFLRFISYFRTIIVCFSYIFYAGGPLQMLRNPRAAHVIGIV